LVNVLANVVNGPDPKTKEEEGEESSGSCTGLFALVEV